MIGRFILDYWISRDSLDIWLEGGDSNEHGLAQGELNVWDGVSLSGGGLEEEDPAAKGLAKGRGVVCAGGVGVCANETSDGSDVAPSLLASGVDPGVAATAGALVSTVFSNWMLGGLDGSDVA